MWMSLSRILPWLFSSLTSHCLTQSSHKLYGATHNIFPRNDRALKGFNRDFEPVEWGHKNLTANEEHDNLNEDEVNKSTEWPTVKRWFSYNMLVLQSVTVSLCPAFSISPVPHDFVFSLLLPLWFRFNIWSSLWMFPAFSAIHHECWHW